MAEIKYTANRDIPDNIAGVEKYSTEDTQLISSFEVNSSFDINKHIVELHLLTLSDEILFSEYDYKGFTQLGNAQSAGQDGASVLTIDPIKDSISYDFNNGGVKLLYHFLNDLFTDNRTSAELYIQDISPDRTELKLASLTLSPEELERFTTLIKSKLENEAFFNEFRLNFGDNDLLIGLNIDTLDNGVEKEVTVKLYEPLPFTYGIKSKLRVVELVADSSAYEVQTEITPDPIQVPTLQPANFNIEIQDENVIPTQYFNYDELFSYPVNNANSQLFSLVTEKGVEISIDHTSYSDFIHFSSAQERLLNFKYKLDLVTSYSASLSAIDSQNTAAQPAVGLQGISGSRTYFEGLMEGVLRNFDHYERFLYYESGSSSWPKSNNRKPYKNQVSNTPQSILWYANQISEAISYDNTNYNSLIFSIPSYLREDVNNENYLTFIHMIGQHFDNLWLYADAVTDKYDADNRTNKGISKDLVGEALKNFGVKLYTSTNTIEDLFSSFVGQGYVSGSETISTYVTGSLIGTNTPIEPSSFDTYEKEIQKRIYHNLSYLLKTKGTERGLRALINCFGIPSDILDIKLYGGRNTGERPFYGDYQHYTSSLDKIRLDHTGSIIPGNTLSNYTSIVKKDNKYTDDLHVIEVGFSPTDNVDRYIISKSLADPNLATFNIDQYIGDPSNLILPDYDGLYKAAENILGDLSQYDVRAFVRLIKFFDNVIFKMVKDFVPGRAVADTGIIIKPNLLNRSKAKSIKASVDTITGSNIDNAFNYTSSINTAFIEGKNGGSFKSGSSEHSVSYRVAVNTPEGRRVSLLKNKGEAKFDGELANTFIRVTTGELNVKNVLKKSIPPKVQFNISFYQDPPVNLCTLSNNSAATEVIIQPGVLYALGPLFGQGGVSAPANTQYFLGSSTGTQLPPTYTFNTVNNYDVTIIYGTSANDCYETVAFRSVACTLGPITAPSSIIAGATYNLANWFTLNANTLVSYTVQKNNTTPVTVNPTQVAAYVFSGNTGDTFTVSVFDNYDNSCKRSVTKTFYTCLILPQEYTEVPVYVGSDINATVNVNLPNFFDGELSNATYQIQIGTTFTQDLPNINNWSTSYTAQQATNVVFTGRFMWVKLINVAGTCERIIKLTKTADALQVVYLSISYKNDNPYTACNAGVIEAEFTYLATLNSVFYEKLTSEPDYYTLEDVWSLGKYLRATTTGLPINGWCSDGFKAYYYTNGYPNPQGLSYYSTGVVLCSSLNPIDTGLNPIIP